MELTLKESQAEEINLTSEARVHYQKKAEDRKNALVQTTSLNIPEGSVIGDTTFIQPELVITSLDEQALLEFAGSFFVDEDTDHYTITRSLVDDVQDL